MVKLRLQATAPEIEALLSVLRPVLLIQKESHFYPVGQRSNHVSKYLDVETPNRNAEVRNVRRGDVL